MIHYTSGNYKYQLTKQYEVVTPITGYNIDLPYVRLTPDGRLIIRRGYCWDGPSGPTIDTKSFMRGSLVHDVFYQLLRGQLIEYKERLIADKLLQYMCIQDGMWKVRAWWVYQGVHRAAWYAAMPSDKKKEHTAP